MTEPSKFRLECPFDLDSIFTMTYSVENLKGVLEFILDNLGKTNDKLHALDTKLVSRMMQVDKNRQKSEANANEIEKLKQICKELEGKSVYLDDQ